MYSIIKIFNNTLGNHISFSIALMTAAGIFLCFGYYSAFLMILLFGAASTYSLMRSTPKKRFFFLSSSIIFFTIGLLSSYIQQTKYHNTTGLLHKNTYDLLGTVYDITESQTTQLPWLLTLSVHKIRNSSPLCQSQWIPSFWYIRIYSAYKPTIEVGDLVQLFHIHFGELHNQKIKSYLLCENIITTLFLPACSPILINKPSYSLSRFIHQKSITMLNLFKSSMSPVLFSLFTSVFLGNRHHTQNNSHLKKLFKQWGLLHFLARSGLHMVMIAFVLHFLCTYLALPFVLKHFLVLCILLLYATLTWSSIPFIRALITYCLTSLGTIVAVEIDTLHMLNIAFITTLLINPAYLIGLNFQLSFAITYALVIISRIEMIQRSASSNY